MDNQYKIPKFYLAMAGRIDALAESVPGHIIAGRPVDNELAEIGASLAILKDSAPAMRPTTLLTLGNTAPALRLGIKIILKLAASTTKTAAHANAQTAANYLTDWRSVYSSSSVGYVCAVNSR